MKNFYLLPITAALVILSLPLRAQEGRQDNIPPRQTIITSTIDTSWPHWKERSYGYGMDPSRIPLPVTVDAPLQVNSMIQLRTDGKYARRWGYHCLEAYSLDKVSRFTLLMDKHVELGRPVAELYYFGDKYTTSEEGYNWLRIGSDVKRHSYMFSRDHAVFYGGLKLISTITLGNIGKDDILKDKPAGGHGENNTGEETRHVNYKLLKEGGDGTMFYDKDHNIVVIKVNGEWMRVKVAKLPKGVKYDF